MPPLVSAMELLAELVKPAVPSGGTRQALNLGRPCSPWGRTPWQRHVVVQSRSRANAPALLLHLAAQTEPRKMMASTTGLVHSECHPKSVKLKPPGGFERCSSLSAGQVEYTPRVKNWSSLTDLNAVQI